MAKKGIVIPYSKKIKLVWHLLFYHGFDKKAIDFRKIICALGLC